MPDGAPPAGATHGTLAAEASRNVSFNTTQTVLEGGEAQASEVHGPTKATPGKSALKQRGASSLPKPERYQHPDALLRRLRLVDGLGKPVSLKDAFQGVSIVLFYFGCQWSSDRAKNVNRSIADVTRQYAKDVKPWLCMEWNDGSSVAPGEDSDAPETETTTGESFLLADDDDLDASVALADPAGTSYLRPFSRVYMACLLDVLMTPTVAVYHVGKKEFLDKNVRLSRLRSGRAPQTIAGWLRGEPSPSLNFQDALHIAPFTAVMVLLFAAYLLLRFFGGEQWQIQNLLPRL
ncbi:hypothetical protein MSPP1_004103 [Malassezia sp. CBS 17886]|nr:hypothetical protein MSPP1_004103 [Malassezia sp. CBS 17886]